ncbi:hypothetical protein C8R45DRAFT_401323 [Mycena sanguinolenta]|nr:hypothetical protein C8R45DRAFT_401323 [Mycena sanguinolenta]
MSIVGGTHGIRMSKAVRRGEVSDLYPHLILPGAGKHRGLVRTLHTVALHASILLLSSAMPTKGFVVLVIRRHKRARKVVWERGAREVCADSSARSSTKRKYKGVGSSLWHLCSGYLGPATLTRTLSDSSLISCASAYNIHFVPIASPAVFATPKLEPRRYAPKPSLKRDAFPSGREESESAAWREEELQTCRVYSRKRLGGGYRS